LKWELERLRARHLVALDAFHRGEDAKLEVIASSGGEVVGFQHFLDDDQEWSNLSCTSTCIRSMLRWPGLNKGSLRWDRFRAELLERYQGEGSGAEISSAGLPALNAYTSAHLLPVFRLVGLTETDPIVVACIDSLYAATRAGGVAIEPYPPSGYLTYCALVGLEAWGRPAPEPALEWSRQQLHRQISLCASHDDEYGDAFELGFNLLVQYRFARDELRESLVTTGLSLLFESQLPGGSWEKKNPLFRFGDIGEAYPFAFELLNSILDELRLEDRYLRPYEGNLRRALDWAVRNAKSLPRSARPPGGAMNTRVWRSGQRSDRDHVDVPESWATAHIYLFFHLFADYVSRRMVDLVLSEYGGAPARPPVSAALGSLDLEARELPPVPGRPPPAWENARPVRDLLRRRVADRLRVDEAEFSLARQFDARHVPRAGILCAPAGVGKATVARRLARYLGWSLIVLEPADFARDGVGNLSNRVASIFDRLLELEDAVILLSDMGDLLRDRGDELSFDQRVLTNSLLSRLQGLRAKARCIVVLAAERYEGIDAAVCARLDFRWELRRLGGR
jgi:hypothetical protein